MLLTLSTTHTPATDLGFLLHKHPDRVQTFPLAAGRVAHVFYPQADAEQCTAALLLDVDPVTLARKDSVALGQYLNDRPYAAGSLLAVALSAVFKSAMNGVSSKQQLADTAIPLQLHLPAVPARGDAGLVGRLFEPLGWSVEARVLPMDPQFPQWGASPYVDLRLTGTLRVSDALRHLYVLLPVLDDAKHYWVNEDEVAKLLRAGAGWLPTHPEREFISRRYLKYRPAYVHAALSRLATADDTAPEQLDDALTAPRVAPLAEQRRARVVAALLELGAQRVLDLGCGPGALVRELLAHAQFTEIVGLDVSAGALEAAERSFADMPDRVRNRLALRQSALTYVDATLRGYDAAVLMEVIEHVDESRLAALEHAVFGAARPRAVIITTPNVEYNVRFEALAAGQFRHLDHRFEWTRAQFRSWAQTAADRYGYSVRYFDIGPVDPELGPPTQAAIFEVTP